MLKYSEDSYEAICKDMDRIYINIRDGLTSPKVGEID